MRRRSLRSCCSPANVLASNRKKEAVSEENRRHSVRIAARLEVRFRANDVDSSGFIDDLSETGAWIDTPQPLPVGTEVGLTFEIHDAQAEVPVSASGLVVRVEPTVGMAVEFTDLDSEISDRIRFYVGALFFGQDPADLA